MATTIYTYLHNDDLKGSRFVSMDGGMCRLYDIRRDDSAFFKDFSKELQRPALYVLLNQATRKAYIGETDDFMKRITQHMIHKEFWDEVIVYLDKNEDTISKTEVQYLEYLAYNKAIESKSFDVSENTQSPKLPHMNVIQRSKTENFFRNVQFLTQFVGCDIFIKKSHSKAVVSKKEQATGNAISKKEQATGGEKIFYCTRAGSNAKGYMREDGKFVVLAGSELRSGECDSLTPKSVEKRQAFIDAYCSQSKGKIILKADYTFTSPSAAAGMVVGGSSNGWTRWKDAEGRTLNEVFRANSTHKRTKTKIANTTQITGDNDLSEKLKGRRIKLSINGKGPYSKCEFGYRVIEEYLLENPTTTFKELQQLFPHDLVGSWSSWPLLQPDLEFAQRTKEEGRMRYFEGIGGGVFTTSDGIKFMVSNQWDWKNLPALLRVVEEQGMTYEIWK